MLLEFSLVSKVVADVALLLDTNILLVLLKKLFLFKLVLILLFAKPSDSTKSEALVNSSNFVSIKY